MTAWPLDMVTGNVRSVVVRGKEAVQDVVLVT